MALSEDQERSLSIHIQALSLVLGATLAVLNTEVPEFKTRALDALRTTGLRSPEKFSSDDARAALGLAGQTLSGLDDM